MLHADRNPPFESAPRGFSMQNRERLANPVWILGVLAAVVWFGLLGSRPLFRPDEGRYAEIPREMAATGEWLVPHLDGLVYIEKPPLQYWITASLYTVLGTHFWVARLATGLPAALGIVLVGWGARRLFGAGAASIACAVCASSPLFFVLGQMLTLDMMFTFFLTAALITFCIGQSVRDDRARCRRWMMLCWIAIACAVMTKGIAALAIPALVLVAYSLWQKDTAVWRSSHLALGLGLCLALVAPWFLAMSRAVPGFAEFFFIHEHLLRYTTLSANRYQPWWFFIPIMLVGAAPWLPQIVSAWRSREAARVPRGGFDARRLLWVWAAVVLVFFSASKSKLIPYVLPVIPALALLIAGSRSSINARTARLSFAVTLGAAATLLAGLMAFSSFAHEEKQLALLDLITPGFRAMALVFAVCGFAGFWLVRRHAGNVSMVCVATAWFAGGALLIGWTAAAAGPLYSSAAFARSLASRLSTDTHVYSVSGYEQTLPFYLGRLVDVVDFRGELDFGMRLAPSRALSMDEFQARWRGDDGAVAVMLRADYERLVAAGLPMSVIERDPHYILVGHR
jgi:4-amino-4-deoxy-L-arabinose transferase-like glycosyltransferase